MTLPPVWITGAGVVEGIGGDDYREALYVQSAGSAIYGYRIFNPDILGKLLW